MGAVRCTLASEAGQKQVNLLRRRLRECQGAVAELEQVEFLIVCIYVYMESGFSLIYICVCI